MACRADPVGVAVIHREPRVLAVIECRPRPGRRSMATLAGSWEECLLRRVAWIGRILIIGLVATIARCWQRRVVAIDVTFRALPWWHRVRPRQWKCGVVVIERGVRPDCCVMAHFARRRESRRSMRGVRRAGVILLVAGVASRRIQVVVVVDVAIGALPRRDNVRTGQRESRAVVVKGRIEPSAGAVALIAGLREIRRDVVRISRALVILEVAGHAGGAGQVVVVVDMAIGA